MPALFLAPRTDSWPQSQARAVDAHRATDSNFMAHNISPGVGFGFRAGESGST